MVVVVLSLQPKKMPGVSQVGEEEEGEVVVGSLQPPKKPGEVHVVDVLVGDVIVKVGSGALLVVVVISSLQPNQPGVLHVC